jgi:hypothetical protein
MVGMSAAFVKRTWFTPVLWRTLEAKKRATHFQYTEWKSVDEDSPPTWG